jgi:transcription-repair coupling factor (superfamily II helicase)
VGFELYQSMLEETIEALKGGDIDGMDAEQWSPQIQLGMPVLLPESYIADLQVRLGLYRRLSGLVTREAIDQFAMELVDRFGPLPLEAEALLDVMELKALCRRAGVAQLDAGTKGASVAFRKGQFSNPDGLVRFITASKGLVRLQQPGSGAPPKGGKTPEMKLLFKGDWEKPGARMKGVRGLLSELADMADAK